MRVVGRLSMSLIGHLGPRGGPRSITCYTFPDPDHVSLFPRSRCYVTRDVTWQGLIMPTTLFS